MKNWFLLIIIFSTTLAIQKACEIQKYVKSKR